MAVWKEELGNLCIEKEAIKKEPNGSSRTENRLSKLTQKETENLTIFTVIKEIEFKIILPFTKKSLGPDDFTYKFYQTHKKKCQCYTALSREMDWQTLDFMYEFNITLLPKLGKKKKKIKRNYRPTSPVE